MDINDAFRQSYKLIPPSCQSVAGYINEARTLLYAVADEVVVDKILDELYNEITINITYQFRAELVNQIMENEHVSEKSIPIRVIYTDTEIV
jgi:hypothetical protein